MIFVLHCVAASARCPRSTQMTQTGAHERRKKHK